MPKPATPLPALFLPHRIFRRYLAAKKTVTASRSSRAALAHHRFILPSQSRASDAYIFLLSTDYPHLAYKFRR
jgi:hypothetical protein